MSPRSIFSKMIGARRLQLDCEASRARAGKLLGMDAWDQAARATGRQNPPRLRHCERAAIAENIAELRKPGRRDRRNPALHEQVDIRVGPAAKFRRNDVRAEKRPGDIERLLLMQLFEGRRES